MVKSWFKTKAWSAKLTCRLERSKQSISLSYRDCKSNFRPVPGNKSQHKKMCNQLTLKTVGKRPTFLAVGIQPGKSDRRRPTAGHCGINRDGSEGGRNSAKESSARTTGQIQNPQHKPNIPGPTPGHSVTHSSGDYRSLVSQRILALDSNSTNRVNDGW